MTVIGQQFYSNKPPVSVNELVEKLRLPKQSIEHQLQLFDTHGLLVKTDSEEPAYTPARPLEEMSLKTVIDTVREPGPNSYITSALIHHFPLVDSLLGNVEKEMDEILGSKTMKDIIKQKENIDSEFNECAVTPITTGRKKTNE